MDVLWVGGKKNLHSPGVPWTTEISQFLFNLRQDSRSDNSKFAQGLSWTILLKNTKMIQRIEVFFPLCWLLIWVFFLFFFFVRISEIEWKYKNTLVLASFLLLASHTIWPTRALLLLVPLHFNDIYLTFCSVYPWLYYYYYYSFLLFLVPGLPQSFCILLDHHHHSC